MNFASANPYDGLPKVNAAVEAEKRMQVLIDGMMFAAQMLLESFWNANESSAMHNKPLTQTQLKCFYLAVAKDWDARINRYLIECRDHPDEADNVAAQQIYHDNLIRRKLGLPTRDKGGHLDNGIY